MEMPQTHFERVPVIFTLKINLNNCTKPPPWFMHGEYLYYVNIEQNFSSNFTQSLCNKQGMLYTITRANAIQLLPHLRQVYGDFPGLWTYNNEIFNEILNTHMKMRSCFQFNANSETFQPENCTKKSGYICKYRYCHSAWSHTLFIFTLITINESDKNVMKYFLRDKFIYYIEIEPKFTSNDTQQICDKKDMMYTIMKSEADAVFTQIEEIYGISSSLWTYDNQKYNQLNILQSNSCFKLTTDDLFSEENCSTLLGFICKRRFDGGSIRFKNGTKSQIDIDGVHRYCNPQIMSHSKTSVPYIQLLTYESLIMRVFSIMWLRRAITGCSIKMETDIRIIIEKYIVLDHLRLFSRCPADRQLQQTNMITSCKNRSEAHWAGLWLIIMINKIILSDHNWYNALSLCDDIGMDMLLKDKYELVTLVTKNYGDNIEYWLNGGIIRNNLCSYFKSSTVQQSKCSETKGVICESAMTGGTVRFKNGTEIKFGLEIPHYCELHEDMMIYNAQTSGKGIYNNGDNGSS
ncbi:hypothetical protein FF38_11536 [Lucilia cuprina]|uniref:C-type lectin domain-containing protein n=1 Tax=Lucilia cuprina TaxID=7375 RepID=A0A0L0CDK9_LUCCU|nr:hypothetical protein FF38_11536 [Lucilia cuprina]